MRVSPSQDDTAAQAALLAQLRQRQATPIRTPRSARAWGQPSRRQLAVGIHQLATLLRADVPLVRALDLVAAQAESHRLQTVLRAISARVQAGEAFAQSLAAYPQTFPRLTVSLVQVGEQVGLLAEVLTRLAGYLEQADAFRRKVQSALLYPALILVVAAGATVVLLVKVIPLFAQMFRESGVPLPMPTQIVLAASDALRQAWGRLLLAAGGSLVAGRAFLAQPRSRLLVDRLALSLPLVGALLHQSALARWAHSLSTLLASGVPLVPALAATQETVANRSLEQGLHAAREAVLRGEGLAAALAPAPGWPALVAQLISVGEETGQLAAVLAHLADYYTHETEYRVQVLTTVLEPLLIVVVAVVIGGLLVAMYLPIFSLSEVVV